MKPQTAILVGVAAYFLTLTVNRFLGERNYKSLSPEDKTKLIDEFSWHRSMATYIPIAIMACVIAVIYFQPALFQWLFPVAIALVLVISLILQLSIVRHLGSLGLPDDFVSNPAISSGPIVCVLYVAHLLCHLGSSGCSNASLYAVL